MNESSPQIKIQVDPTNPGQFFACCGLLELADRLTGKAQGWFEKDKGEFAINAETDLETLAQKIVLAPLAARDKTDKVSSLSLGEPFHIRIDWWKVRERGADGLKTWAGPMNVFRIAQAMQKSIPQKSKLAEIFDFGKVVRNPNDPKKKKKVEPFYFDARRGANAHSRDVGFSINDLKEMKTITYPAVEFLCLVGLQRARPVSLQQDRHYRYHTWGKSLSPFLLPPAVMGIINPTRCYEFESWFRDGDQKKYKAFSTATLQPV